MGKDKDGFLGLSNLQFLPQAKEKECEIENVYD